MDKGNQNADRNYKNGEAEITIKTGDTENPKE